jgi:uncharacterized membrane protein
VIRIVVVHAAVAAGPLLLGCSGERASGEGRQDTSVEADSGNIAAPLRALGTEPFWALDIDSTGLRFITPDDTSGIRFPPLVPTSSGDTVVWVGETERAAIDVRIWRERCSDGMSDRVYTFAATVRIAATTYRGCADARSAIVGSPSRP